MPSHAKTETSRERRHIAPFEKEYEGTKAELDKTGAEIQQMIQERQLIHKHMIHIKSFKLLENVLYKEQLSFQDIQWNVTHRPHGSSGRALVAKEIVVHWLVNARAHPHLLALEPSRLLTMRKA